MCFYVCVFSGVGLRRLVFKCWSHPSTTFFAVDVYLFLRFSEDVSSDLGVYREVWSYGNVEGSLKATYWRINN